MVSGSTKMVLLPGKLTNFPWKLMVGRCISYWNCPFSGDMLVFRGAKWVAEYLWRIELVSPRFFSFLCYVSMRKLQMSDFWSLSFWCNVATKLYNGNPPHSWKVQKVFDPLDTPRTQGPFGLGVCMNGLWKGDGVKTELETSWAHERIVKTR